MVARTLLCKKKYYLCFIYTTYYTLFPIYTKCSNVLTPHPISSEIKGINREFVPFCCSTFLVGL